LIIAHLLLPSANLKSLSGFFSSTGFPFNKFSSCSILPKISKASNIANFFVAAVVF